MFMSFHNAKRNKFYHVKIARTWQDAPNDLHVQFMEGAENYFPEYDEDSGYYVLKHNGERLEMYGFSIQSNPETDSQEISAVEQTEFWYSPNLA